MGLVDINLDDVPAEFPTIPIGEHLLTVKDIKNEEGSSRYEIEFIVDDPSKADGCTVAWARHDMQYAPARIQFKQLCLAAGLSGGGQVDTAELIGKTVRAVFKQNNYTNESGETIESTQVGRYNYN